MRRSADLVFGIVVCSLYKAGNPNPSDFFVNGFGWGGQEGGDEGADGLFHGFDGAGGIERLDALGVGFGQSIETLFDALEEGVVGFFHTVADGLGGLALQASGVTDFEGNPEEEGEVGLGVTYGEVDGALDVIQVEAAAVGLVGEGRIVEAVAEDDVTLGEGGADDFVDELCAAGVEEEEFGLRAHGVVLVAMLEGVADFFADGCSSGFTEGEDVVAEGAEVLGQALYLGGFTAAFGAFERDEEAGHVRGWRVGWG